MNLTKLQKEEVNLDLVKNYREIKRVKVKQKKNKNEKEIKARVQLLKHCKSQGHLNLYVLRSEYLTFNETFS